MPVQVPMVNTTPLAEAFSNKPLSGAANNYQESKLRSFQLKQAQEQEDRKNLLRDTLKDYDISNPKGQQDALQALQKKGLSPEALDMQRTFTEAQNAKNVMTTNELQLHKEQYDAFGDAAIQLKQTYDGLIAKGIPQAQALAQMQPLYISSISQLSNLKQSDGTPMMDPEHINFIKNNPQWNPQMNDGLIQRTAQGREWLDKQIQLNTEAERTSETKRHDIEMEKQGQEKVDVQQKKLKQGLAQGKLDSDTVTDLATQYNLTGKLPALGRGDSAMVARAQILNEAAAQLKAAGQNEQGALVAQAGLKAGQQAYGALKKSQAMVGNYEKTALKNMQLAQETSNKVDRTRSPALNRWILAGRKSIEGDPDVTAFNTAITTFVEEYAKVMTGATGAAAATDSARNHAYDLINTSQSPEQLKANMEVMRQEMSNRMSSYDEQLQELQGQMGVGIPNKNTQPTSAPSATTKAPTVDELLKKYGGG